MEDFVENVFTEAVTEISVSTVGGGLEKVEAAKEAELSVIAKGRSKFTVRANFTEVD